MNLCKYFFYQNHLCTSQTTKKNYISRIMAMSSSDTYESWKVKQIVRLKYFLVIIYIW